MMHRNAREQPGRLNMIRFPGEDIAIDRFRRLQVTLGFEVSCLPDIVLKTPAGRRDRRGLARPTTLFELFRSIEFLVREVSSRIEANGGFIRSACVVWATSDQHEITVSFERGCELGRYTNRFFDVIFGAIEFLKRNAGLPGETQEICIGRIFYKTLNTKMYGFSKIS